MERRSSGRGPAGPGSGRARRLAVGVVLAALASVLAVVVPKVEVQAETYVAPPGSEEIPYTIVTMQQSRTWYQDEYNHGKVCISAGYMLFDGSFGNEIPDFPGYRSLYRETKGTDSFGRPQSSWRPDGGYPTNDPNAWYDSSPDPTSPYDVVDFGDQHGMSISAGSYWTGRSSSVDPCDHVPTAARYRELALKYRIWSAGPVDTDGDGLFDDWETDGVDLDDDGSIDIDLPAMGADPEVRDLFIESTWMEDVRASSSAPWLTFQFASTRPSPEALDAVVDAFAAAPGGPIRVHIDAGPDSVMNPVTGATWGSRSRAHAVPWLDDIGSAAGPPNWSTFDLLKTIDPARIDVFHSAIHANRIGFAVVDGGTATAPILGASDGTPGDRFALGRADDRPLTQFEESGLFMHELGHNLGLRHEGGPSGTCNRCPEYHSVMNYLYANNPVGGVIDYSRGAPYDDWANLAFKGGTIGDPIDADDALVDAEAPRAAGDGALELVGPYTFLADTGDTGLYVDVHNPSATAAAYTVQASGDLDLAPGTKGLTVAAGGTGRVTFTVDTDALTAGTADLNLALASDLLGVVDELDAEVDVIDPATVAQDLASARYELAGLTGAEIDPAVKAALVGQVEEAIATVPDKPHAPFASWSAFVKRQFTDLTATQPTAAQLASWTTSLTSGAKTKGDLIAALRVTADNTSKVDATVRLYRALLGRAPDAGGLRFWVSRRRSGNWTLNRMADSFVASSEFKAKYGKLTNRQYATRIYTDVLGRTADAAGVTYWTGKLDRKERTRGSVMVGFSESSEYKAKQAQNTDVAVAHVFLLGRAPTTAEAADWVARQKAGTTMATLAKELLGSAAYRAHITG